MSCFLVLLNDIRVDISSIFFFSFWNRWKRRIKISVARVDDVIDVNEIIESVINSTVNFLIEINVSMSKVSDVVAFDLREMTIANRWFIENWLIDVDVDVVKDFLINETTTKDFLKSKSFDEMTILIDEMTKNFCKRFNKNTIKRKTFS